MGALAATGRETVEATSGWSENVALFITGTDSGGKTLNLSEVVGAGATTGIGDAYYPADQNQFVKTYHRWLSQIIQDGVGNMFKEFRPEVSQAVFHHKD